jgi:acyl-homoserine lactone acylase PvdQ
MPGHEIVDLDTPYLLALRWSIELPDRGFDAVYGLNRATTVDEARAALRHFVHASQTVLIAHRDGTIAWQITGALPLRRKGLGTFPAPGWSGEYGWSGYIDRRRNPSVENPASALLVTANNRTLSLDAPIHVSRSWEPPYRAQRIRELLANQVNLTSATFASIQLDRESIEARHWIRALDRIAPELEAADPAASAIAEEYLLEWDATFNLNSRSAALFVRLRDALNEQLFGDELQADLAALSSTYVSSYSALQEAVRSGQSSFWDDTRTARRERPAQIWGRALRQAWNRLTVEQDNAEPSRLENLRELVFPHAFHRLPLLGPLFDVGPMAIGGDNFTVNVAKSTIETPEKPEFVPSYRFVLTPGHWSDSRGTQTLGQSGHRFSRYRTDQLQDWLQGRLHAWYWNGPPTNKTIGTLKLLPGSANADRRTSPAH